MKFDGELTLKNNLPYSAEDIARINAIDVKGLRLIWKHKLTFT